ncbi:hypothetical protein K443DRAFT_46691, partial [Laccaria amethystina LaAM-08-1]
MTLAHRTEVLDAHMGDNNWKKLVNMVSSLCKKWKRIQKALPEAEDKLRKLSATASNEQLQSWDSQESEAQNLRVLDPQAMDIYEAKAPKLPNQKDVQAELMAKEQSLRKNIGLSLWISTGIKLQETQFMKRLDTFEQEAVTTFLEVNFSDEFHVPPVMDEYEHPDDFELLQINP